MENKVFLEVYTAAYDYNKSPQIRMSVESFITYCIYKYCSPVEITLNVVPTNHNQEDNRTNVVLNVSGLQFVDIKDVPWQVASCMYPVVLYKNTIITGLCAVARHISKYKTLPPIPQEHEEGLLGFRKSCLQAPNVVSIWTKFCEVDIIKTTKEVLDNETLREISINLVRFENHLKKPVRVHNVYKLARNKKKNSVESTNNSKDEKKSNGNYNVEDSSGNIGSEKSRHEVKNRKWKSNKQKEIAIESSVKIEHLDISHQFAEGPFFTLADLILLPSYHIIILSFGSTLEPLLPLTHQWYNTVISLSAIKSVTNIFSNLTLQKKVILNDIVMPTAEDVSLHKRDPKRHNPKKRLFTKEDDIENALSTLTEGMELNITNNEFEPTINWNEIPMGANPSAGHLPCSRVKRKTQQLENLARAVLKIANDDDLIVDFCSGSGHLGILIAYLLPQCTVILLENKEQSLLRARIRVSEMGLKNVYFFQCNLDFYIGKFDVGVALHACGTASDLVLDKCFKSKANFVLCPCCYGSLQASDRLVFPFSNKFSDVSIDNYLCLGHASDQTHAEHPLGVRGARCMVAIDSDRAWLAKELGYEVRLTKLKPPTCTPKNNLLIGVIKQN